MSFAENLKQARKQKGLSQENLAELLGVSRQAVSKWEQDEGYPEVEKLLLLSQKLEVSLDSLLESGAAAPVSSSPAVNSAGCIRIISPHENVIVSCYKVISSQRMRGGKDSPHYALSGVSPEPHALWGQPTTFLGWYAEEEDLKKEIRQIEDALAAHLASYQLQYSVKTQAHWLSRKIVRE